MPWLECRSLTKYVDFLLGFSLFDFYFCLKSLKHLSPPDKPKENKPWEVDHGDWTCPEKQTCPRDKILILDWGQAKANEAK